MTEHPILFSPHMVRALLNGSKTQTRRIAKRPVAIDCVEPALNYPGEWVPWVDGEPQESILCPYGVPGDTLWVRETFRLDVAYDNLKPSAVGERAAIWYEAGGAIGNGVSGKTRVSIHMPRWASRITLRVTEVRLQRLDEISETDAEAEGCVGGMVPDSGFGPVPMGADGWTIENPGFYASAGGKYQMLWNEIYGEDAWDANPWVWAVSFEVVHGGGR